MTYSTGDIRHIIIKDFNGNGSSLGDLVLDVMLDDGTTYAARVKVDPNDYKYDLVEDLNYELGHKKRTKMENMRDLLLTANYSHEDIKEFIVYINGDEFSAPF